MSQKIDKLNSLYDMTVVIKQNESPAITTDKAEYLNSTSSVLNKWEHQKRMKNKRHRLPLIGNVLTAQVDCLYSCFYYLHDQSALFYWLCVAIFQLFERKKSENRVIPCTENKCAADRSTISMIFVSRVLSTVIIFYRKNVNQHVSDAYRSTATVRPTFR